jgi:Tfp pilus assembly protein PilF
MRTCNSRTPLLVVVLLVAGLLLTLAGCPATLKRNPKASMTYFKLGHDYFRRALKSGNGAARDRFVNVALIELRRSLKQDHMNSHSHFLIAMIFMYKGQKSVEEMEVLQCSKGAEAVTYRKESDTLMGKALVHLRRAFELRKKKDSRIALNLSTLLLYFKRYTEAEAMARSALSDIAYNTPYMARSNIGRAQFHRGRLVGALGNLKQAVFREPRFCPGHYWLGRVVFAQKKFASAAKNFDKALECCVKEKIAPIQAALLYHGMSLVRIGKRADALAALEKCVKQAPKSCVALRCSQNLKTASGSKP